MQFDVDAAEINKNIQVDASVIGDLKEILIRVNEKLEAQNHLEWMKEIMDLKEKYPLTYPKEGLQWPISDGGDLSCDKGRCSHRDGSRTASDVGGTVLQIQKSTYLLSSGGLGTMGYGLGAAIGAQIGNPDKQVINIAGDGCFRMNMNEIATAARENCR